VNDWVSGDTTSWSWSISPLPVMARYCLSQPFDMSPNPGRDFILTCVKAGRVALSPDFSPWVQNMWLVTLISTGSPYSFRETLLSPSASCAFGGLLGHRQPSLCVSIESSFSPSQKPPKKPLKFFTCPAHPILPFLIFSVSIMYFPTAHFLLQ